MIKITLFFYYLLFIKSNITELYNKYDDCLEYKDIDSCIVNTNCCFISINHFTFCKNMLNTMIDVILLDVYKKTNKNTVFENVNLRKYERLDSDLFCNKYIEFYETTFKISNIKCKCYSYN